MKCWMFLIPSLLIVMAVSGCTTQTIVPQNIDGEFKKIADNITQAQMSIDDNKIVWADSRNGNSDIFFYDIGTDEEYQLTTDTREDRSPSIYNNRITYIECTKFSTSYCRSDLNRCVIPYNQEFCEGKCSEKHDCIKWGLFLSNIDTKGIEKIFDFKSSGYTSNPVIFDDNIVYKDNNQLIVYNILSKEKQDIARIYNVQSTHDIFNNLIVWNDKIEGKWGIYIYDLDSRKTEQISKSSNFQAYPKIHKNRVVWLDNRNFGNSDVYLYDLNLKVERNLGGSDDDVAPDIYEEKIVWSVGPLKGGIIYVYDLISEELFSIKESEMGNFPKIYYNNIIWQEYDVQKNQWDIYLLET